MYPIRNPIVAAFNFYKKVVGLVILFLVIFIACADKSTEIEHSINEQNKQQIATNQGSDTQSSISNSASKTENSWILYR